MVGVGLIRVSKFYFLKATISFFWRLEFFLFIEFLDPTGSFEVFWSTCLHRMENCFVDSMTDAYFDSF